MGCCAVGTCTDPACYLCTVVAKLPQPPRAGEILQKRDRSTLRESAPLPDLSAPRAAGVALGQRTRHRVGPHR